MTLDRFIEKYHNRILTDAGAYKSDEFVRFALDFKSAIKDELKSIGAKLVSFSVNHYDVSGFIERAGKYVYFSYSEPRYLRIDVNRSDAMMGILTRTAKSDTDYRGGVNHFTNFYGFKTMVDTLLDVKGMTA